MPVYSQNINTTGFYIILDEDKRCASSFEYLHQKLKYCLSKDPFISSHDFEAVSEIHYDSIKLTKHIRLKLSNSAFKRLQILADKLPNISLALVIDNTIIGSFNNIGIVTNPIPINSDIFSSDIEWIYTRLKSVESKINP
jgi:hypothetical protein